MSVDFDRLFCRRIAEYRGVDDLMTRRRVEDTFVSFTVLFDFTIDYRIETTSYWCIKHFSDYAVLTRVAPGRCSKVPSASELVPDVVVTWCNTSREVK